MTLFLLCCAAALVVQGYWPWSTALIGLAAVAFHTEYRLIVDAHTRIYQKHVLVRPFSKPKFGSLNEIESIGLFKRVSSEGSVSYGACFNFRPENRYESGFTFPIATGSLQTVIAELGPLIAATGIPVVESKEMVTERKGIEALQQLQIRAGKELDKRDRERAPE